MSFAPVAGESARALILGSWPSPQSRQQQFYYGHPRNRFWPLLATLAGQPAPLTVPEKRQLILQNVLALWDVLESCTIRGASDASIRDAVPNAVPQLARSLGVQAVFCNGAAAWNYYCRFHRSQLADIPAFRLPSTSPANAAFDMRRLEREWQPLRAFML